MSERYAFPVSFSQERLFFLERLDPGALHYNLAQALGLSGPLDARALEAALRALVARHEALRTTLEAGEDGGAVQVVTSYDPQVHTPLAQVDLTALGESSRRAEAQRRAEDLLRRPFHLEHGPLLRTALLRLHEEQHVLVLVLHHIVCDATSLEILLREFAVLYNAAHARVAAPLPALPLQFADFAVWQREELAGEGLERRLAFWREQLKGCPAALELPTDRPRPAIQSTRGRNHPWNLGAERLKALGDLGRASGATLFMTLLASFAALLSRLSGQEDLVLGTGAANRDAVELEGVVGFFVNTLVLRNDLGGDPSFIELLTRTREKVLAATAHGDVPFEKLVDHLGLERDLSRTPLFQVVFDLHSATAAEDLDLADLEAQRLPIASGTAKFDLTLSLGLHRRGVRGLLQANRDLFDTTTINRWLRAWDRLLVGALEHPERPLSTLPLLDPAERHQLLVEWRGDGLRLTTGPCLHELLDRIALQVPERVALEAPDSTLTYGTLHTQAHRLATHLRALGAGPEQLVGIALPRRSDLGVAIYGVLASGAAYLPLDPGSPDERLRGMLADSGTSLVVTAGGLARRLHTLDPTLRLVDLDTLWDPPKAIESQPADPSNLAYVIYTSGSTGRPKGVMVPHANVVRLFTATESDFAFDGDDTWTLFHSYAFDFSVWELFGAWLYGGRLVVVPRSIARSPRDFHRLLTRERVTVLNQTPSAFFALARVDAEGQGQGLGVLRWVHFGGEALSLEGLRRWFEHRGDQRPRLVNLFGITETTVHVTRRSLAVTDLDHSHTSPIGGPIADLELFTWSGTEAAPLGVPGELLIGGTGLARGYLGRPGLTAQRFVPHPCPAPGEAGARLYRSGDLARRLPSAELHYLGRMDRQLQVRGFRIEPGEIEAALEGHAGVARGVVMLDDRGAEDRRLVAYVVPREDRARPLVERLRLEKQGWPEGAEPVHLPNGLVVAGSNRGETHFLYQEIFAQRSYLRGGITLPPAARVLDAGANLGMFSLFAAAVSPGAQIWAFEPVPAVHELLVANARLHGLEGTFDPRGLAAEPGEAELLWYPKMSVLSGRFADPEAEEDTVRAYLENLRQKEGLDEHSLDELLTERLETQRLTRPMTTLSQVIRDEGIETIDLLKIDVEKSELEVLAGLEEDHWPRIRQLVVEVHDLDGRLEHLTNDLETRGFEVVVEQDEGLVGTALYTLYARRSGDVHLTHQEILLPEAWTWSDPEAFVEDVRQHLANVLPEHMVPGVLVPLPELPLTTNGKLDRAALPEPSARVRQQTPAAPRNALETTLSEIWQEVLGLDTVGVDQNFFDLGGHSLLLTRVHGHLRAHADLPTPSMVDLFRFPTVATLATHLETLPGKKIEHESASEAEDSHSSPIQLEGAIAVIGMGGRFPGAPSVEALWRNLRAGVESVRFFSDEELAASGVPAELYSHPDYVPARAILDDVDHLDAAFFGLNPRQTQVLDPQQRLLLEQTWVALEDAGYPPEACPRLTSLFAGASRNTWMRRVKARPDLVAALGEFPVTMANQHDFLTTRISYTLDLGGPSLDVQTACSTSLVAVHLAYRSLLDGTSDLALAGGVSVKFPQRVGHLHQEGAIVSVDGHCRPFDASATGTVAGEGVAVVVLKRLEDALADGDTVRAVIRGTALNNDGAAKVGYAAPGVDGQAAVIAAAQATAGVAPETVGYVEAHGTGTPLGDPIEVTALAQAFAQGGDERRQACALGSLKGNFGHLDAAAGVTGLIKTVLTLEHGQIPPSLGFERPNEEIDFASTPFYVNHQLRPWPQVDGPRRAGVSAFGVGGTNAHAVLEEAPRTASVPPARSHQVLVLSARSEAALEAAANDLYQHLEAHPEIEGATLADAAHTLRVGRRAFPHRRAVVVTQRADALTALSPGSSAGRSGQAGRNEQPVAFLLPGQGVLRPGATAELYAQEPGYRQRLDECFERLNPLLENDPRALLFPSTGQEAEAAKLLKRTEYTQPLLFAVEHSLTGLWSDWGVKPQTLLGHSLGEYVAACLAGIFSLDDGLTLVTERGRRMQGLPPGAMLAIPRPEGEVAEYLSADPTLDLAAVNGPQRVVVSGPVSAVERLVERLAKDGVPCRRLKTSQAFHSAATEPLLEGFARYLTKFDLHPPQIPCLSNVTGTWLRDDEATDPAYWAAHLRHTVRFADGLDELLSDPIPLVLEIGPGGDLAALARRHRGRTGGVFAPLRSSDKPAALLDTLGGLWCAGARVNWEGLGETGRRRIPLPTYPFERQRFGIDLPTSTSVPKGAQRSERPLAGAPAGGARNSRNPSLPLSPSPSHPPHPRPAQTVCAPSSEHLQAVSQNVELDTADDRLSELLPQVVDLFAVLLGLDLQALAPEESFLDLGADSLVLIQASRGLEERFGVQVPFRRLLEDLPSPAALANHLAEVLPPTPPTPPTPPPTTAPKPISTPALPDPLTSAAGPVAELAREHLKVMSRLLDLMERDEGQIPTPAPAVAAPAPKPTPPPKHAPQAPAPYQRHQAVRRDAVTGLDERGQRHVDELIARYTARTAGSKSLIDNDRSTVVDPRAISGFRTLWKEMVYPIVSHSSSGSHFNDVDGNQYIDLNMGFGVHLFGHSPEFLREPLAEQLAQGVELGPRSALAGEVAQGVCELTGMERVAFCATGTEAVMTALRAARTVTRRSKIALFAGSYHGSFDGTLAKAGTGGTPRPMASGVLPGMVQDLVLYEYGSPEAIEQIAAQADELAAVLVEPVQSRRPDLQPVDFLKRLRQITQDAQVPLIFDEIVTGFRLHPAGAAGLFGVHPDLATYGKVLGGGLPLGLIAGRADLLDALDGGPWRYGDTSTPDAELTFFAGTFSQHPLSLAAARAVLQYLRREGPGFQETLNRRAAHLAARLDAIFQETGAALATARCGSILRFLSPAGVRHGELLYFHLVSRGVYAGYGRPIFLSTAHTEDDLDRVVEVVGESVRTLCQAGFLGGDAPRLFPSAEVSTPEPPAPRILPLTAAQRQIWVLSQNQGASSAYNQSLALHLEGPLDIDALRLAFQDVVDRHEALRITFHTEGEHQKVHPSLPLEVPLIERSPGSTVERSEQEQAFRQKRAREPFDLERGPLLRAHLLRRSATNHLLVTTFHHIISDGWSLGVVLRDLAASYDARRHGHEAKLGKATAFSSYVEASRAAEEGSERNNAEAFWRGVYQDPPPPLELPMDHPPKGPISWSTKSEQLVLDDATVAAAKAAGTRHGATSLTTLLTVWQVLLHRLSGSWDFALGVPSAGQLALGQPELVGFCVELLPLRLRLQPHTKLAQAFATTGRHLLDAQEHRAFSFGDLLEALHLPRTPGRVPLVRTTFNLDREGSLGLPGLKTTLLAEPSGASDFDLDFNLLEGEDGHLKAHLDFRTALFDRAAVVRWLGHFRTLLQGLEGHLDSPVGELPLLDAAERAQILHDFGTTPTNEYPQWTGGLHRDLFQQAQERLDELAVVGEDERWSWRDLLNGSHALAQRLRSLGVGPEQSVAFCLERTPSTLCVVLAILQTGGAYLPLDPGHPPERLVDTLGRASPRVVITQSSCAKSLEGSPVEPLLLDDLLGETTEPRNSTSEMPNPGHEVPPSALAYTLFTSGSTGRPKGVCTPHGALRNLALGAAQAYGLSPQDRVLQFASLAFDVAAEEIFATWIAGGTVVLRNQAMASSLPALVERVATDGLTVLNLPASFWHEWVDALDRPGGEALEPPPCLRLVVVGNEPVSATRVAAWRERFGESIPVWNAYGLTEATVTSTVGPADGPGDLPVPIGRPLPGVRCYVLDPRGEPVPPGVDGGLYLAGEGLARGYLHQPVETAARFLPNPFTQEPGKRLLRTGDRARWLLREHCPARLLVMGREDRQVKVRGHRVAPEEVEQALGTHPDVRAAAVTVRPDAAGVPHLTAYVVPRTAEAETTGSGSEVWPSIGEYLAYDELMYYSMTTDEVRTTAYRQALAATAPGKVMLDVGTGRDVLLARMALEAGAKRVYAIELLEESYRAGRERLESLGLSDRIHLVHGNVLDPALKLGELVDICVSEVIGTLGSSEGVIPLIHAARRFVKPGGTFIPEHCFTRVAAVELPEALRRDPAFSTVSRGYTQQIFESVGKPFDLRLCLKGVERSCLLSSPAVFEDLRLDGLAEPKAEQGLRLTIERPGRIDGFLLWVHLQVAPGFEIDTLNQKTSWLPVFFPLPEESLTVVPGDSFEGMARRAVVSHDHLPDYSLEGLLRRQGKPPIPLAHDAPWRGDDHLANSFHRAVLSPRQIPLDAPALRRFLARHLPPALVPTLFVQLDELPLLPGGKVNLDALPDPQPTTESEKHEPATPTEQEIATLWQEVLGKAPGRSEDFFISGGHSLLATRLLSRLRAAFGVDVTLEDFFAAPTVQSLAAVVEASLLGGVDEAELGALLQDLDLQSHLKSATHDQA